MRPNRQAFFFLVVCGVVIVLALVLTSVMQNKNAADTEATTTAGTLFSGTAVVDVVRLAVTDASTDPAATTSYVQGDDGSWSVESTTTGATGTLTQATVDTGIADLVQVKYESFPSDALADFGLDKPTLTVSFTNKEGKAQTLNFGNKNPQGTGYFALLNDDKATVYLVKNVGTVTELKNLGSKPPFAPTATATPAQLTMPGPVFPGLNVQQVTKLELRDNTTNEFLILQRDAAGTWTIGDATHKKDAAVEPTLMSVLTTGLGQLAGLDSFDNTDPAKYGLDKPTATITVTTLDNQVFTLKAGITERDGTRIDVQINDFPSVVVMKTDDLYPFLFAIKSPPYAVMPEATGEATAEATSEATAEATSAVKAEATVESTSEATENSN